MNQVTINNSVNQNSINQNYSENIFLRKTFDLEKRDYIYSGIFLVASILLSFMGIFGGFGIGMSISFILMFSVITFYLYKGKKITLFPLFCFVFSLAVSLSFTLTSNGTIRFFSVVCSLVLSLIWFTASRGKIEEKGDLDILEKILLPIFEFVLPNLPVGVYSIFEGKGKKNKNLGMALIGCAVSVPFLLVIIPLLMSSDEAFCGMIKLFFGNIVSSVLKLVFAVVITVLLIAYCFTLKKEEFSKENNLSFISAPNAVLIAFLSVISLCYLAYLFSQLAYFFSAFSGFLPSGYEFTVAKYARRGFFEMSAIAAINFLLIFGTLLLSNKEKGKSCITLRILETFIGIFTLIIISTAISKMILYIKSFGMTQLRIGTSAFMIALFIIFISLILRLFIPKIRVIRTGIIIFTVVLTFLGTFNINSIIASYNYNAYKREKLETIDIQELYDLSHEGIPYIIELAESKDEEVSELAKEYLYDALCEGGYDIYVDANYTGFEIKTNKTEKLSSFSVPYSKANRAIYDYVDKDSQFIADQYNKYYADVEVY